MVCGRQADSPFYTSRTFGNVRLVLYTIHSQAIYQLVTSIYKIRRFILFHAESYETINNSHTTSSLATTAFPFSRNPTQYHYNKVAQNRQLLPLNINIFNFMKGPARSTCHVVFPTCRGRFPYMACNDNYKALKKTCHRDIFFQKDGLLIRKKGGFDRPPCCCDTKILLFFTKSKLC